SLGPALPGTLIETRKKAQDILARARIGQDVAGEKQAARIKKTSSLSPLIAQYLDARKGELRQRTFAEIERHLNKLFAELHVMPIDAITRRHSVEVVDKIAVENGRVAADRAKASAGTFLGWCIERGYIDNNPAMGIKRRAASKPRERTLTEPEI